MKIINRLYVLHGYVTKWYQRYRIYNTQTTMGLGTQEHITINIYI